MWWCEQSGRQCWHRYWLVLLLFAVTACGFEPLYRKSPDGHADASALFHRIKINAIPDRTGQRLHNALRDRLSPLGQVRDPLYRLDVELKETSSGLAILRDSSPTLTRMRLVANFVLVDLSSDNPVLRGRSESATIYSIVESQFANLSALSAARARVVKEISEDIRTQLGLYFLRRDR